MNLRPFCWTFALVAVLPGCRDQAPDVKPYRIVVQVHDELGQPMDLASVFITVWRNDQPRVLVEGERPQAGNVAAVDSLGRAPDSVAISVSSLPCTAFGNVAQTVVPSGTSGSLTITPVLPRIHLRATLSAGLVCGLGVPTSGPATGYPFFVQLQIDTVTDSVRGKWSIHYSEVRAMEGGTMTGARAGNTLMLALVPSPMPSGCAARYGLVAQLIDDSLMSGHLALDGGCETHLSSFAVYSVPQLPYP